MVFEFIRPPRAMTTEVVQNSGLLEIEAAGTGFMLTKRAVFERMIEAYPESRIEHGVGSITGADASGDGVALQLLPARGGEMECFMPEDYAFCRRWRRLGGKMWADPTSAHPPRRACLHGRPDEHVRAAAERAA